MLPSLRRGLRSAAPTVDAMVGNDMLDRGDALAAELRLRGTFRDDARQEAALAELEYRNQKRAVYNYVNAERRCGRTGYSHFDDSPDTRRINLNRRETSTPDAETLWIKRDDDAALAADVDAWLATLTDQQRRIVELRGAGLTLREIGAEVGLNHVAIHRILKKLPRAL